jgi:tetratricopeptide (TPR) repeat protein
MTLKSTKIFIALLLMLEPAFAQTPDKVTPLLNRGEALIHAGQLVQAQAFFERALLRFPENPALSFDLGMVFFLQRNWPKAIENYRMSLLVRPNQVDTLSYLAQAYYQSSELNLARETIARAAAMAPDNADVCQEYGEILAETEDNRTDGLKWLQKARTLDPLLGRIDLDIGQTYLELKDMQNAALSLQAALKKDPANGEAAFFLGESRLGLGDWEKARDNFNYALSHGYSSGAAYYGLGMALVQLGSYEGALAPLKKALELDPSFNKAHFQLSKAYRELGRLAEAQREANLFETLDQSASSTATYTEFDPTQTPVWAHVKALLEENKEQEALDFVANPPGQLHSKAQSINPNYLLGVVYYTMGRRDDAKRVLEIARSQAPTNAEILAYLSVVQLSTGEVDEAERSSRAALILDPADQQALIVLANIRYRQQRWDDVITYLESSHTANPGVLYMLCDAYYRLGKNDQAFATAEAIRTLAANNKTLLDNLDQLVKLHQPNQPASAPK